MKQGTKDRQEDREEYYGYTKALHGAFGWWKGGLCQKSSLAWLATAAGGLASKCDRDRNPERRLRMTPL
jgi:hypothetical protein